MYYTMLLTKKQSKSSQTLIVERIQNTHLLNKFTIINYKNQYIELPSPYLFSNRPTPHEKDI